MKYAVALALFALGLLVGAIANMAMFQPTARNAVVFNDDNALSLTAFAFASDALVCLRGPYAQCHIEGCESVTEGEFSIDVQMNHTVASHIFTRLIETDGVTRHANVENGCVEIEARDVITLRRFEERQQTVGLVLQRN